MDRLWIVYKTILLSSILVISISCKKEIVHPECLISIEKRLEIFFDDGVWPEETTQIKIDSYIFEGQRVFVLPTTGWSWNHPATAFVNENCDTIGHIILGSVGSVSFGSNAEFIETVWSYPN